MTLQHRICLSLCALAIAAHAAPLLENNHLKIKDGAVELDRMGDVVFSENFANGFTNWEASNFENKLVMDVRTVLGEQAAYIGMEKPNSDTAWELAGKPFDVIGGSDFTIKIRAMGTFPLHNPSGHKDMYKMCLYWFDAEGKRLENFFPYRFTMSSKDWTDTYCDGVVPKEAVKAQFFVGFDIPNVPEGEHMAISEVEIIQKTADHSYYEQGSFVSLPYYAGVAEKLPFEFVAEWLKNESDIVIQVATSIDNDNTPGEWSEFADLKAPFTLPEGHSWVRYKAIMKSKGKATPHLKSVTIGDRVDQNWTYTIDKSPSISMLSKSPNPDPASEIRFQMKDGDIIFWQIDEQSQVHGGHIMRYHTDGHRQGYQGWVHDRLMKASLLPPDYQLHQCLFGQHLLALHPDAQVCIVESEKTALLLSARHRNAVWLATCGSSGLTVEKTACLKNRRIVKTENK